MWLPVTQLLLFVATIQTQEIFPTLYGKDLEQVATQHDEPNFPPYNYNPGSSSASESTENAENTDLSDISDFFEVIKQLLAPTIDLAQAIPLVNNNNANNNNPLEVNHQLTTDVTQERYDNLPQMGVKEYYEYMLKRYQKEKLNQDFNDYFLKMSDLRENAQEFLNLLITSKEIFSELIKKDPTFVEHINALSQPQKIAPTADGGEGNVNTVNSHELLGNIGYYEIQDIINSLDMLASICYSHITQTEETQSVYSTDVEELKEKIKQLSYVQGNYEAIKNKLSVYQTYLYDNFIKHLQNFYSNTNDHLERVRKEDKQTIKHIANKEIKAKLLLVLQSPELRQQIRDAVDRNFQGRTEEKLGTIHRSVDTQLLTAPTYYDEVSAKENDEETSFEIDDDVDNDTIDVEVIEKRVKESSGVKNEFTDENLKTQVEIVDFQNKDTEFSNDQKLSQLFQQLLKTEKLSDKSEEGIETVAKSIAVDTKGPLYKEIYDKVISKYNFYKKLGLLVQKYILKIVDIILKRDDHKPSNSQELNEVEEAEVLYRYNFFRIIIKLIERHYIDMLETILENKNNEKSVVIENQAKLMKEEEVLDKYDFYKKFKNEIEHRELNGSIKDGDEDEKEEISYSEIISKLDENAINRLSEDIADIDHPTVQRMLRNTISLLKGQGKENAEKV